MWAFLSLLPSTVLLIAASLAVGAVFGVVGFVCLVLGYTVASELRGLYYDPVLRSTVGLLAGVVLTLVVAAIRPWSAPVMALQVATLAVSTAFLTLGYAGAYAPEVGPSSCANRLSTRAFRARLKSV